MPSLHPANFKCGLIEPPCRPKVLPVPQPHEHLFYRLHESMRTDRSGLLPHVRHDGFEDAPPLAVGRQRGIARIVSDKRVDCVPLGLGADLGLRQQRLTHDTCHCRSHSPSESRLQAHARSVPSMITRPAVRACKPLSLVSSTIIRVPGGILALLAMFVFGLTCSINAVVSEPTSSP